MTSLVQDVFKLVCRRMAQRFVAVNVTIEMKGLRDVPCFLRKSVIKHCRAACYRRHVVILRKNSVVDAPRLFLA